MGKGEARLGFLIRFTFTYACMRQWLAIVYLLPACVCMCHITSIHPPTHPRIIIIKETGGERRALEARKKGGTSETLHDLFFSSLT